MIQPELTTFRKLDKKAISCWRWGQSIGLLILIIFLTVGLYIVTFKRSFLDSEISGGILLSMLILSFFWIRFYPNLRHKRWRYTITADFIELHYGVWFRENSIIPIKRIQHVIIKEGPIHRSFGLADISIYTAATTHTIPALLLNDAKLVRDELALFAKLTLSDHEHDA